MSISLRTEEPANLSSSTDLAADHESKTDEQQASCIITLQ